jgi:hypothetical protein
MSNDRKKEDAIWVDGLRIVEVKEGQGRSWGIGDIVIDPDVFIAWLHKQPRREDGAIRIAVNLSDRTGNWYTQLDTFVPKKKTEEAPAPAPTPPVQEEEEETPF